MAAAYPKDHTMLELQLYPTSPVPDRERISDFQQSFPVCTRPGHDHPLSIPNKFFELLLGASSFHPGSSGLFKLVLEGTQRLGTAVDAVV
jgi:hypothetical protein